MADEVPPGKTGLLDWFARNPRIGLAGTIASIVGIPLAIWLFLASEKVRELRFAVSPSQITIVKAGESSDLHVFYRQNELTSDVSAIQVELWNSGRESIRRENILSKFIKVELQPHARILEANVRRKTRDIVEIGRAHV